MVPQQNRTTIVCKFVNSEGPKGRTNGRFGTEPPIGPPLRARSLDQSTVRRRTAHWSAPALSIFFHEYELFHFPFPFACCKDGWGTEGAC